MKTALRWILAVVAVLAIILAAGCQNQAVSSRSQAPKASSGRTTTPPVTESPDSSPKPKASQPVPSIEEMPSVKIEETEHDFGTVGPDSFHKCQFKFSNVGKSTLNISYVQSTCGCTVPELSKKNYTPGESGVIDMSFHAPAYPGTIIKHLYIISNDPVNPRAELTIKALVEVKVIVEPNRLELAANKENGGMSSLIVKSVDNTPFAITSFNSSGQAITLEFDPQEKKTEHILNPKVDVKKIQEITTGLVQIGVDHPQTKEVVISFNSIPMFEVRPPRIILQNTQPGLVTRREVWVINNYDQSFEIESINSRNGYMRVVNQKKEGLNIGLDVEITPPSQEGQVRRYITDELSIKIKDGPILVIRCSGWFKLG